MSKQTLLILLILTLIINVYSQDKNNSNSNNKDQSNPISEEEKQAVLEKGAWLISKTEADIDKLGNVINQLLKFNIVPQALDRNIAGEVLLISQLSPPALPALKWQLGIYQTEKEMMKALEENAKKGLSPTGMDVQDDAAFVLYLETEEIVEAARMIKLSKFEDLSNSINVYYKIGFIPACISTYKDSIWVLFIKYYQLDLSRSNIVVRVAAKDDTSKVLTEVLSDKNNSLIDVAYTVDDKVIFLFHKHNVVIDDQSNTKNSKNNNQQQKKGKK